MTSIFRNLLFMKSILFQIGVLIVFATTPTFVHAQSGTAPGTRGRTDPVQRELQRRFESEAIEQALAEGPRRGSKPERRRIVAQIKEDFLHIQIVNDELRRVTGLGPLDLEAISKSAGEIAKVARRLKDNLALPQIESIAKSAEPKAEADPEGLRLSLSLLSNSIMAFVENPLFEKSGVVDAQLSLKALRDLRQIIGVSRQLKRSSDRLRRARS